MTQIAEENKSYSLDNLKCAMTSLGNLPEGLADEICLFNELAKREFNCMPTYDYKPEDP